MMLRTGSQPYRAFRDSIAPGPASNMGTRARLGGLLATVTALLASPAMAGCLGHPDDNFCYTASATFAQNVDGGVNLFDTHSGATPQTAGTPLAPQGGASASADSADNGTLEVRTSLNDDAFYAATAGASLGYTFRLTPTVGVAPSDVIIPLHVIASAMSLRDGGTSAGEKATLQLTQDGVRLAYVEQRILLGRELGLFALDTWINVKPSDDIVVWMEAESAIFSSPGSGRKSSGVLLDPIFEIAPEYASQYTLVGLPLGVTPPSSAVPEPATWAMMIGGFALVGSAARRRRWLQPQEVCIRTGGGAPKKSCPQARNS